MARRPHSRHHCRQRHHWECNQSRFDESITPSKGCPALALTLRLHRRARRAESPGQRPPRLVQVWPPVSHQACTGHSCHRHRLCRHCCQSQARTARRSARLTTSVTGAGPAARLHPATCTSGAAAVAKALRGRGSGDGIHSHSDCTSGEQAKLADPQAIGEKAMLATPQLPHCQNGTAPALRLGKRGAQLAGGVATVGECMPARVHKLLTSKSVLMCDDDASASVGYQKGRARPLMTQDVFTGKFDQVESGEGFTSTIGSSATHGHHHWEVRPGRARRRLHLNHWQLSTRSECFTVAGKHGVQDGEADVHRASTGHPCHLHRLHCCYCRSL